MEDFKLNWKRVAITSMFGLGFVGNVGHSAKLLYLRYRSGSRSGNGWMNGWLDGWIFFQKEEVAMDGTLSLSIPVVDLKCKSSVDGLPDSCLQLSDAKGSNRFLDVVTSLSQSMSPSVETSTQFVYNSSLPSTPSSFSDLFVDN
ncbi:hypothetical protein HID58_013228, partial [Brassica napus]